MATAKLCSIDGCGKRVKARGWCVAHYAKVRKYGDPLADFRKPPTSFGPCAIPGCPEIGSSARQMLCSGHTHRKHRYGDPLAGVRGKRAKNGIPYQWLLEHIGHQARECLIWPFARRNQGYGGVVTPDGRMMGAHREMCIQAHGLPPFPDAIAAHSCGNGHVGCVNPKHLGWATTRENSLDKNVHRASSLTEIQIRAMRLLAGSFSVPELADIFGIKQWVVPTIIDRKVSTCL